MKEYGLKLLGDEEKKAGGDGAIDPIRVFKGIKTPEEAAAEKKEL